MFVSIFGLVCLFGIWLFGLDCIIILLIGVGSLICGVVVVMVIELVVCGCVEQVVVVVFIVVVFGILGIFFYLVLFQFDQDWGLLLCDFGIWGVYIGVMVYEVVQVVVVGCLIGIEVVDIVVIVKMVWVMMLVFFLILFLVWLVCDKVYCWQYSGVIKIIIFWFVVGFVLVVGFNLLVSLLLVLVSYVNDFDIFFLVMVMVGFGFGMYFLVICCVGFKLLLLVVLLFVWLVFGGGLFICLVFV